jgi:hypothetical protein
MHIPNSDRRVTYGLSKGYHPMTRVNLMRHTQRTADVPIMGASWHLDGISRRHSSPLVLCNDELDGLLIRVVCLRVTYHIYKVNPCCSCHSSDPIFAKRENS